MALSGSVSTIRDATQKLLQAKAQVVWQQIAAANKTANLPGVVNSQAPQNAAATAIMDRVDPATREKLQAMRKDTESLIEKLSSGGGETKKEAAMRKADEAKRKLKALKLQAQMAAASGDKKAAARIAREVSQLAKQLGQAAKDYGGGSTDAVTAITGAPSAAAAQASAAGGSTNAEAGAATAAAAPAIVAAQPGATPAGATVGEEAKAQAAAVSTAPVATPPVSAHATEKSADQAAEASQAADAESPASDEAAGQGPEAPAAAAAPGKAAAGGAATAAAGNNPTSTAQAELQAKRDAIIQEGAARKAAGEFYNDVRGSMAQLRSLLDQMKRLARRDGEPGTASQMDQASRDMAEGEQMLNDAAGPGTLALPSGTLVQISV